MKNKGFSMVELIIVIAIMAILGAALAPMLLKYIAKSRLSSDIDQGREIAMAIMDGIVSEAARDDAVEYSTTPNKVNDMDGAVFKAEVFGILSVTTVQGKSLKDVDGRPLPDPDYYYTLDEARNKVEIFYGGLTADYMVYPTVGPKLFAD